MSVSTNDAVIHLSRGEVLALRSLLVYAPSAPLELIGPKPIFGRLLDEFEAVIDTIMSDPDSMGAAAKRHEIEG